MMLTQPLQQLGLSRAFCESAAGMGFQNLEAIVLCPPAELVLREGFSYGWLAELSDFLKEKELLHLLQTIPGKSYG